MYGSIGRPTDDVAKLILLGHIERPLDSVDAFFELSAKYEEMGFTDFVVHWPRSEEPFKADLGVLEEVSQYLRTAQL